MKNLKNTDGLLELESTIKEMIAYLEDYAGKDFAHQFIVEKHDKFLHRLTAAYNSINKLQFFNSWLEIETTMNDLETKDREIGGYTIHIQTRLHGKNFALINYNPFQ